MSSISHCVRGLVAEPDRVFGVAALLLTGLSGLAGIFNRVLATVGQGCEPEATDVDWLFTVYFHR